MKSRVTVKRGCAAFWALSSGSVLFFLAVTLAGFGGRSQAVASASESDVGELPHPDADQHDQLDSDAARRTEPRIAVIGGGIGGTSAAYFLRKLLGPSAAIELYEPHLIGGRIATAHIAGRDYESGGSVIHPKNEYMVNFRKEFGMTERDGPSSLMGFYNGQEFVFTESNWSIVTVLRLLWRYRLDCFYIMSDVNAILKSFSRIYELQDDGRSFITPAEMLRAMGGDKFVTWAHTPLRQVLKDLGYSDRFIDEVASVAMRDNYGQSVNMTAFAGMVSLAGVQPGLWAVNGGNKLIPEALLKSSQAVRHRAKVSTVRNVTVGEATKFEVTAVAPETSQESTAEYDMVVVATPLTPGVGAKIDFQGFEPSVGPFGGRYQRTVATFVHGRPNPEAFGKKSGEPLPNVETTRNISLNIRTLAQNFPVDATKDEPRSKEAGDAVYKIFSGDLLTDEQMKALFVSHDIKEAVDWLAYPHYTVDDKMPPFVLSKGVFYVNGIEWSASAMEMSAIGARNAALLAKEHWQGSSPTSGQDARRVKREL